MPSKLRSRALNTWWVGLVPLFGVLCGCGNTLYAFNVNAATSKLEEARELGAEEYAPYEYTMAMEHITKAQTEAAEADYSDAAALSAAAEEYADKAIELSREAHRGAGR